jgi:hypothetical protein
VNVSSTEGFQQADNNYCGSHFDSRCIILAVALLHLLLHGSLVLRDAQKETYQQNHQIVQCHFKWRTVKVDSTTLAISNVRICPLTVEEISADVNANKLGDLIFAERSRLAAPLSIGSFHFFIE